MSRLAIILLSFAIGLAILFYAIHRFCRVANRHPLRLRSPLERWQQREHLYDAVACAGFFFVVAAAGTNSITFLRLSTSACIIATTTGTMSWLIRQQAESPNDNAWRTIQRKWLKFARAVAPEPDGWHLGLTLEHIRIARLLDGRGFVRMFFLLYGAILIASIIAVSAALMDNYDDSTIFTQRIISYNFVLIGSCWGAASGLTIITAALCAGGSTFIHINIQKYFQALAQFTAYSGLAGSLSGAFTPLIAMAIGNLNTLRSVTPTILLDTAAIGATTGFVLGLPLCLPQLINTGNALYKAVPAPLTFIAISIALKKANITPLLIESTLVHHMTANGVHSPKLSEIEALSMEELLSDWPSFMALEESLGNPAIISNTHYTSLSVVAALASMLYAFISRVRANKCYESGPRSAMAPNATASTDSAG